MGKETLLKVDNLVTSFKIGDSYYPAVDGVSFTVDKGEMLAIVGESGSGKSALALSIMGLHPDNVKIEGNVELSGEPLVPATEKELTKRRGKDISMIFQEPLTALNPLTKVGKQIEEVLTYHTDMTAEEMKAKTIELLTAVGIPRPEVTYNQFPHQLSGGMRQRIVIAIAIACSPSFIIADEPTTALDVTIQAQILELIKDLQKDFGAGAILITHDLGVVAEMADKVAVMYAGQIVEYATINQLFDNPQHPYTRSLLKSMPSGDEEVLHVIQGIVPSLHNIKREGCRFAERIEWVDASEHETTPTYHEIEPGHYVLCTCYKTFEFPEEKGADQ